MEGDSAEIIKMISASSEEVVEGDLVEIAKTRPARTLTSLLEQLRSKTSLLEQTTQQEELAGTTTQQDELAETIVQQDELAGTTTQQEELAGTTTEVEGDSEEITKTLFGNYFKCLGKIF